MNRTTTSLALAAGLCCVAAGAEAQRADVNFAFGGATTNSLNATDVFAQNDPGLAQLLAGIRYAGLEVIGMTHELDFATAVLNDVEAESDVFWVYGGTNNYLAGEQDPSVAPGQIVAAMARLHAELGATRFVVPNLPDLGDLPLWDYAGLDPAIIPYVRAGSTQLTLAHNAILEGAVQQFAAATGVHVDVIDVFGAFKAIQPSFANPTGACDKEVLPPAIYAEGACEGYFYLDTVHPASLAWEPVAAQAAAAIAASEGEAGTRRIITIGDSFSDLGMMSDTFQRTLGFAFPLPPFTGGRFTEGLNVIEQVEDNLDLATRTTFFKQPHAVSEAYTANDAASASGTVFVPKAVSAEATDAEGDVQVKLSFTPIGGGPPERIDCKYKQNDQGVFALDTCDNGAIGGDRIDAEAVEVKLENVSQASIDWLFYPPGF